MIKPYNQRFYPNPFRYGKLKTLTSEYEIFQDVRQKFKPFLNTKFDRIPTFIDEFGELKSEIQIIRFIRQRIEQKLSSISKKCSFFTKPLINEFEKIKSFENYEKNLRYLELPVQPITDKHGFEIQALSNELMEDLIEEVEDGFSSIYDYCSNYFPDSIEMWNDYALLNPKDFPYISHDDILETTYEVFDTIVDDLQKNSINLFNWVFSGDINTRLMQVFKANLNPITKQYLVFVIKSMIIAAGILLILRYCILKSKSIFNFKDNEFTNFSLTNMAIKVETYIVHKTSRIEQKSKQLLLRVNRTNLAMKIKYNTLKLILGKN